MGCTRGLMVWALLVSEAVIYVGNGSDIYRDAPQASDALAIGTKGITYRAVKA